MVQVTEKVNTTKKIKKEVKKPKERKITWNNIKKQKCLIAMDNGISRL